MEAELEGAININNESEGTATCAVYCDLSAEPQQCVCNPF